MNEIKVIGAGMAGLLAGCLLRDQLMDIEETALSLPNNHSAVLRFRTRAVGDALGIFFKDVAVIKSVVDGKDIIWNNIQYSRKVTGEARMRSLLSVSDRSELRYIAPPDLISRMANMIGPERLKFNSVWSPDLGRFDDAGKRYPVISTIPMNLLMSHLEYPFGDRVKFRHSAAHNIRFRVPGVELYCSQYYPNCLMPLSRVSVTGDEVIIELQRDTLPPSGDVEYFAKYAMAKLGLEGMERDTIVCYPQKYSKIIDIDEGERRRFIQWATAEFNIYSLGRFATWRPKLLLDDIVNDVRQIQHMVRTGDNYKHKLKSY